MRKWLLLFVCMIGLMLSGCGAGKPKTFTKTLSGEWSTFEIREGVSYDRAWDIALSSLVKEFDLEMAQKADGYIRTAWLYSWSGKYQPSYRVRVTAKFNDARTTLSIKPEAQFLQGEMWLMGTDSRLVSTLKTDLMGTMGRTTR